MFDSTHPFLFFDYFRIPYRHVSPGPHPGGDRVGLLRTSGGERSVYWPLSAPKGRAAASNGMLARANYTIGDVPIYCAVATNPTIAAWLGERDGDWRPATPVHDTRGVHVASVWRNARGSVFLPFDPGEAIWSYWSEQYLQPAVGGPRGRAMRIARRTFYRARPAIPRAVQLRMRRVFSRIQARTKFPRWPVETSLHDLYTWLFDLTAQVANAPVPWLAAWPSGCSWAMVLTHDVETSAGCLRLPLLRDIELAAGVRSSWNFAGGRYHVDDALIRALINSGFEVGIHGLHHDGRDLESLALLAERLPKMRACAERWQAVGFRSPATQRVWEWMPRLGFDYDSSYPDTDPFEPQGGGCCSLLPFFNDQLVELPITLPQDHTLFAILGQTDERVWVQKADLIRRRGGMSLLITHPDYTFERHVVAAYRRFLATFRDDAGVWWALPREVSAWWRRRAASHIVAGPDGPRVVGPAAAEATINFTPPA